MAASTLDILHTSWEKEDKIVNDFRSCCLKIGGSFFHNNEEIQIRKDYIDRCSFLILEIESEESLEWYFEEYPLAKLEPEIRIPYFVFDHNINNGEKLFTIVTSNCYLDDELVYEFFSEYLKINQEKFIYINRTLCFSFRDLEKINREQGYYKGWFSFLKKE
ncbi:MAG: hypothetical protein N4A72_13000 [Bacteroidales bacterium]|jgi:hypothetical protein|nr:hypothetical protein [Bacteroidales bacterium]